MNVWLKYMFYQQWWICKWWYYLDTLWSFHYRLLVIRGLIKTYIINDIKHIRNIPHGIIVINCITISILFSLFVQLLFIDKVSL